jgi:uncharacterized protein (UPF0332 family)
MSVGPVGRIHCLEANELHSSKVTSDDARLLLAQRELDEAAREAAAAELLAGKDFFRQAVTRLYFTAFHVAQGLLATHGLEAATHDGVQRLLGLHFVLPGVLSKDAGRALSALLARQHEADYRLLVDVDQASWEAARSEANAFVAAAKNYLQRAWPGLSLRVTV